MTIPIARPFFDAAEERATVAALRSGWVSHGPMCMEFERDMARIIGSGFGRAVNSGTSAIHLALMACGVGAGDEVIVPAFTCVASLFPIEHLGAIPVPIDIELTSYGLNPSKLEAAITPRTKAILVVHLFGLAADLLPILDIARRRGVPVIEDAALGLGARIGDGWAGSFGLASCLSFHPRKIITTGEGGMVLTSDERIAARVAELRSYGASVSAWDRQKGALHGLPSYSGPGFNLKMTDIQAGVGIEQLRKLSEIIDARQAIARRYQDALASLPWLSLPRVPEGRTHVYQSYVCLVETRSAANADAAGSLRQRLMDHLHANGIASVQAAQSMPMIAYFQTRYGWPQGDFGNAALADQCAVALPIFPSFSPGDQATVVESIRSFKP